MRQTVGLGVLLAVAVAAVRYTGTPAESPGAARSVLTSNTLKASISPPPIATGKFHAGCTAFDSDTGPANYPKDATRGAAKSFLDKFFNFKPETPTAVSLRTVKLPAIRYAIALAPDPHHTNLSLTFDREMVLLQQAAQDEGYTFNSSWLPWKPESPTPSLLADQQRVEDETSHREACPGILLFRKSLSDPTDPSTNIESRPANPPAPYAEALVVFIVGEQPTGGLNEDQWANAIHWLAINPPFGTHVPLNILGPTFSGSLVSMERDLAHLYRELPDGEAKALTMRFPSVHLLSGGVTGCTSIRWFQRQLQDPAFKNRVLFGTFAENDELQIYRFLGYLHAQGTQLKDVTILSEDETAYGHGNEAPSSSAQTPACAARYEPGNQPTRLSYPRDISAVRAAYEKQSVFTGPSQTARAVHTILQEGDGSEGQSANASDTIVSYSGSLSAVAQEAVLYGIVSHLRLHHTRYLMLRCSNPLDFLFLTRFFHRAYPQARVVTVASDLLFRREIDTTEFRGVLALANYPLLPGNLHWSRLSEDVQPPPAHTHRIFDSSGEGPYFAGRYLLDPSLSWPAANLNAPFLTLPFKENFSDYAEPFWLHSPGEVIVDVHPPVWLSVVGRDGYWPLAVLDDQAPGIAQGGSPPASTMVHLQSPSMPGKHAAHYDLRDETRAKPNTPQFVETLLFSLPLAWKLCAVLAMTLIAYQIYAVFRGNKYSSSGLFAPFRQVDGSLSQSLLLGINCAFLTMLPVILGTVGMTLPSMQLLANASSDLVPWSLLAVLGVVVLFAFVLVRRASNLTNATMAWRFSGGKAFWTFFILFTILASIIWVNLRLTLGDANELSAVPLFYRMAHLTSGVSPLTPVLFLFVGFYLWTWQALAGNVLLLEGRPLLPRFRGEKQTYGLLHRLYVRLNGRSLTTSGPASHSLGPNEYRLTEEVGKRLANTASPLCFDPKITLVPLLFVLSAGYIFVSKFSAPDLPLLGMEGHRYAFWVNVALLTAFLLTLAEAARLYHSWIELRRLLLALNRRPLRRTFKRLRAIGPNSLWSVSGSVQRIQFLFFTHQLDAARRLNIWLNGTLTSLALAVECGHQFSENSATKISAGSRWDRTVNIPGNNASLSIRKLLANAVADVFNEILLICWKNEKKSLNLEYTPVKPESSDTEHLHFDIPLSDDPVVQAAEEFVCFHYIAFIQNILARMRTMILSMVFLFVAVCLSISFYPFVPRTQIGLWMVLNLAIIGAVVIYVYADMERDETLSYITNTTPGRLSVDFYIRTATFLAGPILGLLTTQFPSISESILGWLQPGLDALK